MSEIGLRPRLPRRRTVRSQPTSRHVGHDDDGRLLIIAQLRERDRCGFEVIDLRCLPRTRERFAILRYSTTRSLSPRSAFSS